MNIPIILLVIELIVERITKGWSVMKGIIQTCKVCQLFLKAVATYF